MTATDCAKRSQSHFARHPTMMTAAGFDKSPNSKDPHPRNDGLWLLLVAVVVSLIFVVLYTRISRKDAKELRRQESAEQRRERLAVVREKRLQKVKQEDNEKNLIEKKPVSNVLEAKEPSASQMRRRRASPSNPTTGDSTDSRPHPRKPVTKSSKSADKTKQTDSNEISNSNPIRHSALPVEGLLPEAKPSPQQLEKVSPKANVGTKTDIPGEEPPAVTSQVSSLHQGTYSLQEPLPDASQSPQDVEKDSPKVEKDFGIKDNEPEATTATAKSRDDSSLKQTKKKKKKKRLLPPPQLLCEALSHIFRCKVTVEHQPNAGTWGGEGWPKRPSEYPTATGITLSLYQYKPDLIEKEWDSLSSIFFNLLDEDLRKRLFPNKDVGLAAMCHSRASALSRNGFALVMVGDEGFEELKQCIDMLSVWLAKQTVSWILPEVCIASRDVEAATEELGDLFSGDYGGESAILHGTSSVEVGPLEQLFVLLQETAAPVISVPFLEDLFQAFDQDAADDAGELAAIALSYALKRLASSKDSRSFSSATLSQRVAALSNLMTAPSVNKALSSAMKDEVKQMKEKNGHDIQSIVSLSPLLEASAYAIPPAGAERSTDYPIFQQLDQVENFPLCTFGGQVREVAKAMEDGRRTMKIAHSTAQSSLRIAFKVGGKEQTFQWLSEIIRSNESLLRLLKSDLLDSGGLVALSSSREFLLGTTWTLVDFCHSSLKARFDEQGSNAFNASYLSQALDETCPGKVAAQNQRVQTTVAPDIETRQDLDAPKEYSGATRFFFLSCLMLRVGLHPILRMEDEFHTRYARVIDAVQGAALADERPPADAFKNHSPFIAAWLGWKTFLGNPDFASCITEMSLIQLGWLTAVYRERRDYLGMIPEWMCRNPARWLSHLTRMSPRSLKPQQAERAVESVTTLLDLVVVDSASGEASGSGFSPRVVTSLIEVVSSFVRAGVNRARQKERFRVRTGNNDNIDDRGLDVYSSFDRNDLGVTVFAHPDVKQRLCPILLRTFLSVESVEGVDADIDSFSKLSAQSQISELLTRLWCHPSGECRESVASLPACELLGFVSSVSTVARVNLNFGTEAVENAHMTSDPRVASQAAGPLLGMRSLLSLVCALSHDDAVAASLGGDGPIEHATKLSNMIVQFLDTLTSRDGGTNQSLEEEGVHPTSAALANLASHSFAEKQRLVEDLVRRRIRAKKKFGLDVSVTCHQILALAARWHRAAARMDASEARSSPFLTILASNDDCDIVRVNNIYRRLVDVPLHMEGSEVDNMVAILQHDGYVDHTPWEHKYEEDGDSSSRNENRYSVQDQMSHVDITSISSNKEIEEFIADLGREITKIRLGQKKDIEPGEILSAQDAIFRDTATLTEEDYSKCLPSEWVVSSSPFRSKSNDDRLLHKYDKAARTRGVQAPVRLLVKEARKLHKNLPAPSASSAIFVCFAEERMDLCRVVMSGPESTPYAHGLFEFDVFFPPSYPQVPPLVTFMTTGGGRVRFNPNLYTDGKVCISLLGVTTASDESQRWNPEVSSLAQLMITVQAQILGVSDPYFNEGNGVPESMRHTRSGRTGSAKYNNRVRLETIRCAMVDHLRSPPKGFEEVISRHFSMCRQRVVVQARRWVLEARGTDLFPRFERAYAELVTLLDTESMRTYECLAPLGDDLQVLESLEPSFVHSVNGTGTSGLPVDGDPEKYNPWAKGSSTQSARKSEARNADEESDDELYL